MEKRRAFTLIELLVILAIILILASILFPVFSRVRENARRSSCQSNLKQIGVAVMMYVQDHDETYPSEQPTSSATSIWTRDTGAIYPYVKNIQIFECPSGITSLSGVNRQLYGSYGANQMVMQDRIHDTLKMAGMESPSTTYMIMDYGLWLIASGDAWTHAYFDAPKNARYLPGVGNLLNLLSDECPTTTENFYKNAHFENDCMGGRHLGGLNVLFADGHVKWENTSTIYHEFKKSDFGAFNPASN